eukprot:CAMPEP_0201515502 /NCGR_PEP_ID=MMETSP0161_2-20130828/7045_1 /ASSEMBLY_ACC=CAM_ASM_000251 /TAXON_ID=180227 /ORGANISM="Neoparamoeba aestuarina, Strain SoJaBio B1-5/56/2" /LENGTH=103 /DNA_ID=CAMNT_0047912343 /DNA_START=86 /DNA_END=394 /DNA_ORIENTATION=+
MGVAVCGSEGVDAVGDVGGGVGSFLLPFRESVVVGVGVGGDVGFVCGSGYFLLLVGRETNNGKMGVVDGGFGCVVAVVAMMMMANVVVVVVVGVVVVVVVVVV